MKIKTLFLLLPLIWINPTMAQKSINIIPQPNSIEQRSGMVILDRNVAIIAEDSLKNEAYILSELLGKGLGQKPSIKSKGKGFKLEVDRALSEVLGDEGYILKIEKNEISIKARTVNGVFYGIQSFRQILPEDFEFRTYTKDILLPELKITDKARFPWRAFMLDESRHFKGKAVVKDLLDQMALLKMNKFHWHLTDDQGWRIEIKKYPKLTLIGSKRDDTQTARKSEERTGKSHEGFYTQEDIKEIIEYANKLHITIVPEIEMPGHAMAAIAAYPWLGTLGTTTEVSEIFGIMDDSFLISDPKVIRFLEDVLDEVMALFPGEVIHIGGDEVNFDTWKNSKEIHSFMKEKELKSPVDLQIYFTNGISNYIDRAGKRMMGWNDIMGEDIHEKAIEESHKVEEKLALSAIVHFWKGDLELINRAVKEGYDVVNSNHWDTYLDYTYERLPLSKSYAFDPIPQGLEKKYHSKILGLGTQMWSEWIPTVEKMENQIYPRLAAYSESGWTSTDQKGFEKFEKKLQSLKKRWSLTGINFNDK
ncbi:beta-N-acetylhexosaminidase [Salegentibacter salegens]|uniref:beta-N-acetylhexosaminidase n=1 Tax=Salegentibacter salegens TaxID=143223 RepID=A0A1M7MEC3_9FLAO|nr:beta-N-acetylhexosaminidase [Salegentibacter salegens]PRX51640.1 hexosaminidase [Salegentibacter salegens]SHM89145.1 hexosaminidase [Salegentibacter salegens]